MRAEPGKSVYFTLPCWDWAAEMLVSTEDGTPTLQCFTYSPVITVIEPTNLREWAEKISCDEEVFIMSYNSSERVSLVPTKM